VQRCTSDVETLRLFLAVQVMELANAALLVAVALPLMLALSPRMTAISFALIDARALRTSTSAGEAHLQGGGRSGERTDAVIQENLTGIRVVRAFARQDHERAKFAGPTRPIATATSGFCVSWPGTGRSLISRRSASSASRCSWSTLDHHGDLSVGVLFAFLATWHDALAVRQMGRILTEVGKTAVPQTTPRDSRPAS